MRLRDGHRLGLSDRGGGPPILLLHGFTGSVEAWGDVVLEGLVGQGFRVLAVDLPGHGRSDVPDSPDRYRIEAVVEDLVEVLDARDVERADWVGYSMGGRVALGGAVLRPERVRSLVLESASPGLELEEHREARRRSDDALARRILDRGIEAFVDEWMDLPLFASQRRLPDAVLSRTRRRRLRCSPRGLANTLRGLGTGSQPSFWSDLESLPHRTLLLAGSLDAKYVEIARRMAARIPGARRRVVPDAGHTVHLEAPETWLRSVCEFLAPSTDRP